MRQAIEANLGKEYTIKESKMKKPKVKIVGVEEEIINLDDEMIVSTIQKQYDLNKNKEECKIIIVKKIQRTEKGDKTNNRNSDKMNDIIILEVDATTHKSLLAKEKLNIGWNRCKIYEFVNVMRCFK